MTEETYKLLLTAFMNIKNEKNMLKNLDMLKLNDLEEILIQLIMKSSLDESETFFLKNIVEKEYFCLLNIGELIKIALSYNNFNFIELFIEFDKRNIVSSTLTEMKIIINNIFNCHYASRNPSIIKKIKSLSSKTKKISYPPLQKLMTKKDIDKYNQFSLTSSVQEILIKYSTEKIIDQESENFNALINVFKSEEPIDYKKIIKIIFYEKHYPVLKMLLSYCHENHSKIIREYIDEEIMNNMKKMKAQDLLDLLKLKITSYCKELINEIIIRDDKEVLSCTLLYIAPSYIELNKK